MIISLVRCIETSQTENDSVTVTAALNQRAAVYMFAPTGATIYYFYLLTIFLIILVSLVI